MYRRGETDMFDHSKELRVAMERQWNEPGIRQPLARAAWTPRYDASRGVTLLLRPDREEPYGRFDD